MCPLQNHPFEVSAGITPPYTFTERRHRRRFMWSGATERGEMQIAKKLQILKILVAATGCQQTPMEMCSSQAPQVSALYS